MNDIVNHGIMEFGAKIHVHLHDLYLIYNSNQLWIKKLKIKENSLKFIVF